MTQVLPEERASVIVLPKWTADIEEDGSQLKKLVDAILETIPDGSMDLQTFKDQIEQEIAGPQPGSTMGAKQVVQDLEGGAEHAAAAVDAGPATKSVFAHKAAEDEASGKEQQDALADLLDGLAVSKTAAKEPVL